MKSGDLTRVNDNQSDHDSEHDCYFHRHENRMVHDSLPMMEITTPAATDHGLHLAFRVEIDPRLTRTGPQTGVKSPVYDDSAGLLSAPDGEGFRLRGDVGLQVDP